MRWLWLAFQSLPAACSGTFRHNIGCATAQKAAGGRPTGFTVGTGAYCDKIFHAGLAWGAAQRSPSGQGQGLRAADPMAAAAAARELLGFWGVAVRGGFVAAECAYGSFPNQGMNTGGDGVGTA
eukprot:GGOE01011036.1.p4 GENE.GGOE01011036.1~~GGOE01011036.1.p4  ORF type:complete len:124 (-),score=5.14 GGOE01011036.1:762-1133(-)